MRDGTLRLAIQLLIAMVLLALLRAIVVLGIDMWHSLLSTQVDALNSVIVQVLSIFVFVEILQSLIDYTHYHRVRVTYLIDASLAFVLRELWIQLFEGSIAWQMVLALSVLLVGLGALRTLAIRYSPNPQTR